jgi:hypothetical protein
MSTPAHKKAARQEQHRIEKLKREYEALIGSVKRTKKKREFVHYVTEKVFVRETPHYPSLSNGIAGFAAKKEPQVYTGTLIKGIATMHKSNAVPIINKEQAEEISSMRR